jgi:YbbR domain-containing protein
MKTGLLKNWELKILALLSAIVLWFFVVGIENNSSKFPEQIPVAAVNVPTGMVVSNDLGKAIIRIRTDQDLVKNLAVGDFDVTVDLTNAQEGGQDLPLSATSKNDKVTILKVDPATVHVVLQAITQKDIKVKPVVSGNPAQGYAVQDVQVNPQTVTISGGKNAINTLDSIEADIKLSGIESTDFMENVTLQLPPNLASQKNVSLNPEQVSVDVKISQQLQQKTVIVKPDLQGAADLSTISKKLLVTPSTVIIEGKSDILNAIDSIPTEPVTMDSLNGSTVPLNAKLILPRDVTLPDSQPDAVMISLISS